jgi:hypothetical protein
MFVEKFNEDTKNKTQRIILGGNYILNSTSFLSEIEKFAKYNEKKVNNDENENFV